MLVSLSTRSVEGLSKSDRDDIKFYTKYLACQFQALKQLLSKDYIYSPFPYLGYEQGLLNICGEANFVVLDVDYTAMSIYQQLAHLQAEELECILGTTSDPTNLFKYRVLLPLNRPVTHQEYRRLVMGISSYGLIPDLDRASEKPAQKFYSYANSLVVDSRGHQLIVDDYLVPEKELRVAQLDHTIELAEVLAEFQSYSRAIKGSRTRSLLSAAFKLVERGASDQLLEQVILHLNNSFLVPKDINSVYRRVIDFIKARRKYL